MLYAIKPKSSILENCERVNHSLILKSEIGLLRISPITSNMIRISYTERDTFSNREKPGVQLESPYEQWHHTVREDNIILTTSELEVHIDRYTASITYYDCSGTLLMKERSTNSKTLESFTSYTILESDNMATETIQTADGVKQILKEARKVPDENLYHTKLYIDWQEGEYLFGLGQNDEPLWNLRETTVYLHQANRKIAIPMLVSSLGYGLLMDTYSPMIFQDSIYGSYLYTEADDELDYYFIYGKGFDGVIKYYRTLTGKAPLLPKWSFGYLQSQERYETEDEILSVATKFRQSDFGCDCIILDWLSWPENQWGQKSYDPTRFPSPDQMVKTLHQQDLHFMISIWPNMSEGCDNYKEFKTSKLLLPGSNVYNAFSSIGRELYWKQVKEGIAQYEIDAWWCDNSEPFTPEWNHKEKPDPAIQYKEYLDTVGQHLPAWALNAYPLYHSKTLYDGHRKDGCRKAEQRQDTNSNHHRLMNLTRSAYTGQQRYATVLWSGDTDASWQTLKAQILAGLQFSISGFPYWTSDIGAFFVKQGNQWFWQGQYDDTNKDYGYRELYVRWYQWACFLPMFRGHGTDCRREPWNFGEKDSIFYDSLRKTNQLRYQMLPYIYSIAGDVWLEDRTFLRALFFDYGDDPITYSIKDQYLFGQQLMVCPITEPMYYLANSQPIHEDKTRLVYLPQGNKWYDYHSQHKYDGGQWIMVDAPLDIIPFFVKEGTILLTSSSMKHTSSEGWEYQDIHITDHINRILSSYQIRVYTGKNGFFRLYEDAGNGYGYEQGEYTMTEFHWYEEDQSLRIVLINGWNKKEQSWTLTLDQLAMIHFI